ncbi:uracil DNA N-glycosylase Thp1 [Lecanora helva]
MPQPKAPAKLKLKPSKSSSLDAYLSPKKASSPPNPSANKLIAPDPSPDKLNNPDATVDGSESHITTPLPSQPSKRKRGSNDAPSTASKNSPHETTRETKRTRPANVTKSYAPPSTYDHLPPLPDTIIPNLLCVFVGLNPGIQTAKKGHPYAHPSNHYWHLLYTSGLTPDRRLAPSEYEILPEKYSLGNTNIVSRATRDGSELSKEEMVAGAGVLDEKMRKWRPEVVCLVGKGIWEAVWKWKYGRGIRKEEFSYGFQDRRENMGRVKGVSGFFKGVKKGGKQIDGDGDGGSGKIWDGARVFVATSTSGLAATLSMKEKEEIWAELGGWVERRREERKEANGEEQEEGGQMEEKESCDIEQ